MILEPAHGWFPHTIAFIVYPVLIDDKVRILNSIKIVWKNRVTTIFPKQGHYALDAEIVRSYPSPDITLDRIGNLLQYQW